MSIAYKIFAQKFISRTFSRKNFSAPAFNSVKRFISNDKGTENNPLIECEWLNDVIEGKEESPDLVILDCHYKPNSTTYRDDYLAKHIPRAVHADFEEACFHSQYIRRDIHSPEKFEEFAKRLGVTKTSHVVLYDRVAYYAGFLFAAKIWWLFRLYGHSNVSVLNGGFPLWEKLGYKTTSEVVTPKLGNFEAGWNSEVLLSYEAFQRAMRHPEKLLCIDPREPKRYTGEITAFRMKHPGHVHDFVNMPFVDSLIDSANGRLKSRNQIRQAFVAKNLDLDLPVVVCCDYGVKAASMSFALDYIGIPSKLYNGSLFELNLRDPDMIT